MAQDITADALNQIKNAKKARKEVVKIKRYSKLLLELLQIMKLKRYVHSYKVDVKEKTVEISIGDILECRSIKPRFYVKKNELEKYIRRFLPSRNYGVIIISTNKGLMTHHDAIDQNLGGSLIAYFY